MQEIRDALEGEHDRHVFDDLVAQRPTVWRPSRTHDVPAEDTEPITAVDVDAAEERFRWFAPLFARLFPETGDGIIESPIQAAGELARALGAEFSGSFPAHLWVKRDDELAVSGSVKSRGGIHEVLETALDVATELGIDTSGGPDVFLDERVRQQMSDHRIVVGSTGNLGMSIGLMGSILGFSVTEHMSHDAKEWKKARLRHSGVEVVEHATDFTQAVHEGRREAERDPSAHFIDDENSRSLFAGYAVVGRRLAAQLEAASVRVTSEHPLFVYLPCGIGGAPGGISFGLAQVFGDAVRPIFVEPVSMPAFLLGRLTGLDDGIAVTDIGLGAITIADGLAVGRPSGFLGKAVGHLVTGYATVSDDDLLRTLAIAHDAAGLRLEPSACAGLRAAGMFGERAGTHLAWLTGGSLVPDEEFAALLDAGRRLLRST